MCVHRDPETCAHVHGARWLDATRCARSRTLVTPGKGPEAHAIPILIFHPET